MLRLMTTEGLMLCTFTPLNGLTEIVLRFMPQLAGAGGAARRMTLAEHATIIAAFMLYFRCIDVRGARR